MRPPPAITSRTLHYIKSFWWVSRFRLQLVVLAVAYLAARGVDAHGDGRLAVEACVDIRLQLGHSGGRDARARLRQLGLRTAHVAENDDHLVVASSGTSIYSSC